MKLLNAVSMANLSHTFFLPKGSWGGFMLVYVGTNPAVAKTRDDLGNIQLNWNNTPVINVDAELLSYLGDMKGGVSTFTSVNGGALNAVIHIPCGMYGDKNNSYVFTEKDRVYFKLDFASLNDVVGGVIYIYGIPKAGIQNYLYSINSRYVVAGGASVIADTHPVINVSQVFLKNYGSVTQMKIEKDKQLLFDGLTGAIQSLSDYNNEIESAGTVVELDMNPSRDAREAIANEVSWNYTFSGASTLEQYFAQLIFTPSEALKSKTVLQTDLAQKGSTGGRVPAIYRVGSITPDVKNTQIATD